MVVTVPGMVMLLMGEPSNWRSAILVMPVSKVMSVSAVQPLKPSPLPFFVSDFGIQTDFRALQLLKAA